MESLQDHPITLTRIEKEKLLEISRQTLVDYLTNYKRPKYKIDLINLLKPRAVFVTLRERNSGNLRGCRGGTKADTPISFYNNGS